VPLQNAWRPKAVAGLLPLLLLLLLLGHAGWSKPCLLTSQALRAAYLLVLGRHPGSTTKAVTSISIGVWRIAPRCPEVLLLLLLLHAASARHLPCTNSCLAAASTWGRA
jgi:hypothetical protein